MDEQTEDPYREIERVIARSARLNGTPPVPWVTLAWAQTIDGSIAERCGVQTALSGAESMRYTHHLRAHHDAILVGVGTVVADDPRLNTRLVAGTSPRAVVLDSRLRCPVDARVLTTASEEGRDGPLIVCVADRTDPVRDGRRRMLEERGATVVGVPEGGDGSVALPHLLSHLGDYGVSTLMVEGGARILSSFLAAGFADYVAITIVMRLLQGCRLSGERRADRHIPRWSTSIPDIRRFTLDDDLLLLGRPRFETNGGGAR